MKKTFTLLILLFTTLFSANAEEITVWESAEGLAGNLQFAVGSDLFNKLTGSEPGQANLTAGDVLTIYYKDAVQNIDKIYIQSSDLNTTYNNATLGVEELDDYLRRGGNSYYDLNITSSFLTAIKTTGLGIQRGVHGGHTVSYLFTKVTVKKPDSHLPGYEMIWNGEPLPIAWGENPYFVPKKDIVNLQASDILYVHWDKDGEKSYNKITLCYKGGSTIINSLQQYIYNSTPPGVKSFTLAEEDITKIKANNLVISGWYYDLTKAYVEHPSRFVSVTTSKEGLATFSNASEAVDCSWFESLGIRAYKAEISGDRIVTTQVTDAVPAGTGLILQGSPSTIYKLPFAADADAIAGNVLEPTDGSAITGYVLGKVSGNVGFYRVTNKEVVAGKAYIPATFGSARAFSIDFLGNDVTGIEETLQSTATPQAATYNLMGQRVAANQKGFVIVNGKKYINK